MRALSLRLKLTLAFALAMATVLATMSLFVYLRVGGALLASVDHNLRAQAAETATHLGQDGDRPLVDPDADGPMLAQLLDRGGQVVRSTPAGLPPLLNRKSAAAVAAGSRLLRSGDLPGRDHDWRLLAVPVGFGGRRLVLVLAGSLTARQDALHRLFVELLVAGPVALLLASLAGYELAAAALRPVESMRQRAAAISASTPGRRLPVPASRDGVARLAATLNEMLVRLEASFEHERAAIEHERRFIADASHELRTPLALLQTELEVALRRPRPAGSRPAADRPLRPGAAAAPPRTRRRRLAAAGGGRAPRRPCRRAGAPDRRRRPGRSGRRCRSGLRRAGARRPDRQRTQPRRGADRAVRG